MNSCVEVEVTVSNGDILLSAAPDSSMLEDCLHYDQVTLTRADVEQHV